MQFKDKSKLLTKTDGVSSAILVTNNKFFISSLLKLELEVVFVEVVHSDVAFLSAAAVAPAVRVHCYCIDGTKMTFHTGKLFLKN